MGGRSSRISIQARYGSGSMPQFDTVILALAIGGPFLQNHTLVIETSKGGNLTWDGRPLEEAPGTFTMEGLEPGAVQVRLDDTFQHIDPGLANARGQSVDILLPLGVHLTVDRYSDHLDGALTMWPEPDGQDGHCGNFNRDPADDSQEDLEIRVGTPVLPEASLFSKQALGAGQTRQIA